MATTLSSAQKSASGFELLHANGSFDAGSMGRDFKTPDDALAAAKDAAATHPLLGTTLMSSIDVKTQRLAAPKTISLAGPELEQEGGKLSHLANNAARGHGKKPKAALAVAKPRGNAL